MGADVEAPDGTTGRAFLREFLYAGPDDLGLGWPGAGTELHIAVFSV